MKACYEMMACDIEYIVACCGAQELSTFEFCYFAFRYSRSAHMGQAAVMSSS